MLSKTLTIANPSGLHLRPAGILSQCAMKFNVMSAGIKSGAQITLVCDGEDEDAAMAALTEAIESGLGE